MLAIQVDFSLIEKMNKKVGKITVKHYLNKRTKSMSFDGELYYPLYIQIIVAGHKAQIKSKVSGFLSHYEGDMEKYFLDKNMLRLVSSGYFSESLMDKILVGKVFPFYSLFNNEIEIIQSIINSGKPFTNKSFSLYNISSIFDFYLKDIQCVLDDAMRKYYLSELNEIFLEAATDSKQKKVFNISNFFIHYINWENNFCAYYEITYEVLPTEIKFIENYLSDELKRQIKAGLAFHSRVNYLKRFLDKTEKGLFPNITFLDWKDTGMGFVLKELTKLMGKQKAAEYINSIDLILTREILQPIKLG